MQETSVLMVHIWCISRPWLWHFRSRRWAKRFLGSCGHCAAGGQGDPQACLGGGKGPFLHLGFISPSCRARKGKHQLVNVSLVCRQINEHFQGAWLDLGLMHVWAGWDQETKNLLDVCELWLASSGLGTQLLGAQATTFSFSSVCCLCASWCVS